MSSDQERSPPGGATSPASGSPPASSGPSPRELRLHRGAIAVGAVDAIGDLLLPLAVLGGATLLGGGASVRSLVQLVAYAGLATVVALGLGYVRWATTTYRLDPGAVHLRRGVLQRQQASVPVERITSIDTVQGPVHRLLGVIELKVQAAGGGQEPEITLQALSRQAAAAVRQHAAHVRDEVPGHAAEAPPSRRLSRGALFVAALTSGQITVVLPLLAALSQTLDEVVGAEQEEAIGRYLLPETLGDALVAIAVLVVAAWLLAIAGTIVAFSGFTVTRDRDRLRISRGLLQRRVSTIPVARVQAIRVVEGLLRQPLGLASLRVESAGYAMERSVNTTLFPLVPRRRVDELLGATIPELAFPIEPLERPPPRAAGMYLGAPLVAATAVAVPLALALSPIALLLLPLAAALGALRLRAAGWRLREGSLVARSRRLARTTILAAGHRLPERSFVQGPVARRLRLASFAFALASRTRWEVAHLEEPRVRALLDELRPRRRRERS